MANALKRECEQQRRLEYEAVSSMRGGGGVRKAARGSRAVDEMMRLLGWREAEGGERQDG